MHILAVGHNMAAFSELYFAVHRQEGYREEASTMINMAP